MKLKKVAALCASAKAFHLYDQPQTDGLTRQWLGDGACMYPLDGMPYLQEQELYRVFDVAEKTQVKLFYDHRDIPAAFCVSDWVDGEKHAENLGITIFDGGKTLVPLRYFGEVVFIQRQYVAPLEDQMDFLEFYIREMKNGERYVAAKTGMLLAGIILPVKVGAQLYDKLGSVVENLGNELTSRRMDAENVEELIPPQMNVRELERKNEEA